MKKLNNLQLKIGARIVLQVGLSFAALMIIIGFITTSFQNKYITQNATKEMNNEINNIRDFLEMQISGNQKLVSTSLVLAHNYIYGLGTINEESVKLSFNAVNQVSKESKKVAVNRWTIAGTPLQNNTALVDRIKSMSVETATIFQKIDGGYLRISTNVMKTDGSRATGTYIPDSSPVIKTIEKGETFYGRAFVVNDWYLTAYEPIKVKGEIKGILYVGVREKDMALLEKILKKKKYFENGYPFIAAEDGTLIIHPTSKGDKVSQDNFERMQKEKDGHFEYSYEGKKKMMYFSYHPDTQLYIATTFYTHDFEILARRTRTILAVSMIAGALVFCLVVLLISRSITTPVKQVQSFVTEVASGDLTARYHGKFSRDEVGQMAESVTQMVSSLKEIVAGVITTGEEISSLSGDLRSTAVELSERSTDQAANVEEITSNIEEINASMDLSGDNLKVTDTLSRNTSTAAAEGGIAAEHTVEAMRQISEKISLIEDIAYQTNLLALNAAIEAARAGENGKGFSVVATEVRKLAEKSQSASQNISSVSKQSMDIGEKMKLKINSIVTDTEQTAINIESISTSTEEQLIGVRQISEGAELLNRVSQDNAESAESLAEKSMLLEQSAKNLHSAITFFKIEK
jgi:methyl-accepting chemotaxis protein